MSIRNYTLC